MLYKKWNYIVFFNGLVTLGIFILSKNILFSKLGLHSDLLWSFKKVIKVVDSKILNLKKKYIW